MNKNCQRKKNKKLKFLSPWIRKKVLEMLRTSQPSRTFKRLLILKLIDDGQEIKQISKVVFVCEKTISNVRMRFINGGLDKAIYDGARTGKPPVVKKKQIQKITALACSDPPEGYARWTLSLIRNAAIENKIVNNISREKVRIILMEHELKPWKKKMWCIPSINSEFIERMEDVLDLYEKKINPKFPVICLDEKPIQLLGTTKRKDFKKAGMLFQDYEYVRKGTANAFCIIEPKKGKHYVRITSKRKATDFAETIAYISSRYRRAKKIHLVMDNLNTHKYKSLIKRFGYKKAARIWKRFITHYTPKHASWLNQAEIQINMFTKQCLGHRRIDKIEILSKEASAWANSASRRKVKIDWKFTKSKARTVFKISKRKN